MKNHAVKSQAMRKKTSEDEVKKIKGLEKKLDNMAKARRRCLSAILFIHQREPIAKWCIENLQVVNAESLKQFKEIFSSRLKGWPHEPEKKIASKFDQTAKDDPGLPWVNCTSTLRLWPNIDAVVSAGTGAYYY